MSRHLRASVVVPSSGRPGIVEQCIEGLCRQSIPVSDFEVIIVDDGCSPPVESRLTTYAGRLALTCLRVPPGGPAAARNAGARRAGGSLLVFLDDDCVPSESWLAAYLAAHEADPSAILTGPVANGQPSNQFAEAYHMLLTFLLRRHVPHQSGSRMPFLASANFAVERHLFLQLGGFDEEFRTAAEDRAFCAKAAHLGHRFRFVPEAAGVHLSPPLTLFSYASQQFSYGRGACRLRRWSHRHRWPASLESPAFYGALLREPMLHGPLMRRVRLSFLVLLSQVALASGLLWEALSPQTEHRSS